MNNLTTRIISAAVIIPFLIALVFLAPFWLFLTVTSLLSAVCGYEFGTISLGPDYKRARYLTASLSLICAFAFGVWNQFPQAILFGGFLLLFLCFIFFLFSGNDPKDAVPAFSYSVSGSLYSGVLLGFVPLIFSSQENGRFWVFTLLLATFLGDTFAYAFGKLFGKHRLSPRLSPNKTWEGSFGSCMGSFLSVLAAKLLWLDLSLSDVVILSVSINVFCQLGDLSESFLKRGFGVKDSGTIIPGHGGALDRLDALMFGAPVMFFFIYLR